MDDRGIWKLALAMLSVHDGIDVAASEVAGHAEDAMDCGNLEHARTWRRVLGALRQLGATSPPAGAAH
jgi:hypothetical protein